MAHNTFNQPDFKHEKALALSKRKELGIKPEAKGVHHARIKSKEVTLKECFFSSYTKIYVKQ